MSANSISSCSSFRFLTTRTIPKTPFLKTPSFIQIARKNNDHTFFSFRPITFQKLPTTPSSSSSTTPSPSTTEENSLQPIEELPPKLQEIVKLFQSVEEPKAKYEQLLFYGKNLKPLEQQFKTNDNKVQGCVSQVWVRAYLDPQQNNDVVVYEADSDSLLTKGLAALLVTGFSGRPVSEIVRVKPDFVHLLGLQQSLTPSRNNGFLNMLKLMQKKALMLFVEAEKGASELGSSSSSSLEVKDGSFVENSKGSGAGGESVSQSSGEKGAEFTSSSEVKGGSFVENSSGGELSGRGRRIKEKLEKELDPVELEVEDVSYQHAGHAGVRGSGDGETHFNLRVVSKEFEGKSLVKRHRLIYKLLDDELQSGLHALSIVAKTPSEVNEG
ncbi:hypothetical protein HN51_021038 [Arachis hypogaea]|uniref:SufE-like protein 1, chloroplastic/mitochondrial n=1 Tax=Arachis duranensis TaxID=130453 RepID=A0A6P4CAS4_ARADU|nr:sufE-like protein 1, chloroplastic/mitochondrial [Arachis duranensis]XP_025637621.1 sufE-like protein 1, chloroplastic/mitochondrial [Arachis hypogaea]XP_029146766.1 sufE-like protein 1, chloroplastic/mitochondrial [Arachis hypogaea]QHO51952.1 SufE-like protein 1/mitochondrial [Arachis hypogaea]